MSASIKLEGVDNLLKNLKMLKSDVQLKTARAAGRKAAVVIRDAARENAARIDDSETAENIAKNIVVKQVTKELKTSGDVKFVVGVQGGAASRKGNESNPGGNTSYWRFIEFGTSKVAARPFMLPALRDNIGSATDTFMREFDAGINRALKRMKKQ